MKDLDAELGQRRAADLYRQRRTCYSQQGPEMEIDSRPVVTFCSNDYLGLANHPAVNAAFHKGIDRWGTGSGAAHLISGHSAAHHALEEELADFTGRERALLFSTGYMANLGVASALLGRADAVFEDRFNHASLLDAGLLAGARFQRYRHSDPADLAAKLAASRTDGEKLVATDGVFSMDGDIAPLSQLAGICRRHAAWLMVDDAHGLGVIGDGGKGSLAAHDLTPAEAPILMGTLGKAFGTFGAFVAGDRALIETLIQQARTYIYTTAPPPALAEATRVSLRIARREQWRRNYLQQLVRQFKSFAVQLGLPLMESTTPIQPLLIGDSARAVAMSEALLQRGILVSAIRPPTVPQNSARLRITFSAAHSEKHLLQLTQALEEIFVKAA
ncbi:MAG TPA: 8-amino-7-oxononanoate synthase [Gammaproteobacteria bacterium]|jgi:8-amino-7-oxononanoate synthase